MSTEAQCKFGLMVAMDGKAPVNELDGEDAGLWQAIYYFLNLNIHMDI
jgi:hypothetical protein